MIVYYYSFSSCVIWVLNLVSTLREEQRMRMFENMVLRKIFQTKREEVVEGWRKMHTEEHQNL